MSVKETSETKAKNGYYHMWCDSLSELIGLINSRNNSLVTPGETHDLQQVIQFRSRPDCPAEGETWIGIVYKHTPPQDLSAPEYLETERTPSHGRALEQIAKGKIQVDLDENGFTQRDLEDL